RLWIWQVVMYLKVCTDYIRPIWVKPGHRSKSRKRCPPDSRPLMVFDVLSQPVTLLPSTIKAVKNFLALVTPWLTLQIGKSPILVRDILHILLTTPHPINGRNGENLKCPISRNSIMQVPVVCSVMIWKMERSYYRSISSLQIPIHRSQCFGVYLMARP